MRSTMHPMEALKELRQLRDDAKSLMERMQAATSGYENIQSEDWLKIHSGMYEAWFRLDVEVRRIDSMFTGR